VRAAIDAGFKHFDLAPAYGDGLLEREFGRIAQGRRASVHIATKFGIPFKPIGDLPSPAYFLLRAAGKALRTSLGAQYDRRDFSPKALIASLDSSLRRLRTDHVDLLLVHEPRSLAEFKSLADVWPELERQQRLGRIRQFGVSGDTQMLLDAERERLVPDAAVRMIPMNDVTCALPDTWFENHEVFVFNIVKHLRKRHPEGRIETPTLVEQFAQSLPAARPIFASNDVDEIRRLGEAIAKRRVAL
jgi:predicted oxidoreductase